MAIENARLYAEIVRKDARIQKELSIAQVIQHGLFPETFPTGPAWDASAHFLPARELGGDLYDFYEIGDGVLGMAIGDVAGKGVPAALYGAFASGTVRSRAFERHPPADVLRRVNRTLCTRGVDGLFCTLAFALFDFVQRHGDPRQLRACPIPLHYRAATGRCEPIVLPGLPLGAFEAATYDERVIDLEPGDVIVFHTDGVSESHTGGEDYGLARLRQQVEQHAGASAAQPRRADPGRRQRVHGHCARAGMT